MEKLAYITTKEYAQKVTVTLSQLRQMQRAQRNAYDAGIVKPDTNYLSKLLGSVAGVLGLLFVTSTPAGVAAGVVGIVSSLSYSEKEVLKDTVYSGYWNLGYMEDFMVDNPKYGMIEMELPFLEYNIDGKRVRFISGKGIIVRVKTSGGWIYN